ncbi:ABC transporter ATP-binding protein [Gulosibacter sp. 10]|uniref:ABC transporter ATP-binding protein n=1 Tax=Gulosibacter sp. 10 TaxID=1255570 RepID=UPI00097EF0DD|nr:ABC transporter ATP-binding protein [Gulosibacter sp. 10]SJM71111.1 Branched-chain amino acid transport ATP-binding protein LivG (TC 3.A.1.4.1) [Gulosibacter sp. 10]
MSEPLLLRVDNVSKRFGGVKALDGISLEVEPNEIIGIIGPNGAGKTSFFNIISGLFFPDEGTIEFDGKDVSRLDIASRARAGVGRTFQVVRPFTGMTVVENVMVPLLVNHPSTRRARARALELLEDLGIAGLADLPTESLTLAMRKRVEVARALATEPKLLLLDEVLAGLNSREAMEVLPFVHRVRERGVAILMIEHIVAAVTEVSDRMLVLDRGSVLAEGSPQEVVTDPKVVAAYLGSKHQADTVATRIIDEAEELGRP